MNKISSFFSKFQKILSSDSLVKELIVSSLKKHLNIEILISSITIKNKIVNIKAHPIIKNEILIKKIFFLKKIKEDNPGILIEDIK